MATMCVAVGAGVGVEVGTVDGLVGARLVFFGKHTNIIDGLNAPHRIAGDLGDIGAVGQASIGPATWTRLLDYVCIDSRRHHRQHSSLRFTCKS